MENSLGILPMEISYFCVIPRIQAFITLKSKTRDFDRFGWLLQQTFQWPKTNRTELELESAELWSLRPLLTSWFQESFYGRDSDSTDDYRQFCEFLWLTREPPEVIQRCWADILPLSKVRWDFKSIKRKGPIGLL
jgi:hypothetical protein